MDMVGNAWQMALDEWISTGNDRPAKALRKLKAAPDAGSIDRLVSIALGEIKPAKRPRGGLKAPNQDNNNGVIVDFVMGFLKNHDDLLEARRKAKSEPWADWEAAVKGLELQAAKDVTEAMQMTVDRFAKGPFRPSKSVTFSKVRSVMYDWLYEHHQGIKLREVTREQLLAWWALQEAKEKQRYEAWQARRRQENDAIRALLIFFCG